MCGILGFIEHRQERGRQDMQNIGRAMAQTLSHRGPDDEGLWQDPDVPLLLGQRRLSIIDLSPEGHQPMESHSGRYVVSFNGEIYNFSELRKELEDAGAKFRGRSDTEVMLGAFDIWGVSRTLQKIDGMFAIILWDKKQRQIHFVRDRLGKKPLYAGWAGNSLVFGSELKALRAHPDFTPRVSRDVLALYMRYACVPAPYSIYEGVWQVLPGACLTLGVNDLAAGENLAARMKPYWAHAEKVTEARLQPVPPEARAVDEFEQILKTCVAQRMISDVPLGAFLSGGIDSSAVVALMQQISPRPVKTFTIGFHEDGFDEAAHARQVAAHLGAEHHELYLSPRDALDVIPSLPEIYDEPFADESQIPTYMVSRFARRHVTVALTGDGGDDMLGGYKRHLLMPGFWKRVGWLPRPARLAASAALQAAAAGIPGHMGKLMKAAEVLSENDAEGVYNALLSRWTDPDSLVLGARELPVSIHSEAARPRGLNFAERLIYQDQQFYLPHDLMVKTDRASMAASLECRSPLLDRRIFEYAWRLPLHMKIRKGKGKWILRKVLARYLPEEMFDRPKQGFGVPVGAWMKGPLREWAEDLLDETALRQQGFFDPAEVRKIWDRHASGDDTRRIWTVLMFQAWRKRWA